MKRVLAIILAISVSSIGYGKIFKTIRGSEDVGMMTDVVALSNHVDSIETGAPDGYETVSNLATSAVQDALQDLGGGDLYSGTNVLNRNGEWVNLGTASASDSDYLLQYMIDDEGNELTIATYVENNISGSITATDVAYEGSTVQAMLDQLLYVSPVISSYRIDTSYTTRIVEEGTTQSGMQLSWLINDDEANVASQIIDNIGIVEPTWRAVSIPSTTVDTTYGLSVTDGTTTNTASVKLDFRYACHYGESTEETLTSAQAFAMTKVLGSESASRTLPYEFESSGEYPYYIYPAAWGNISAMYMGVLGNTDITKTTNTWMNGEGSITSWITVRPNTKQTAPSESIKWE